MPNILWIWDMCKFKLCNILIQTSAIRHVAWDPRQARLALCTNNNKLYMWSAQGCVAIEMPCESTFLVQAIRWTGSGNAVVIVGKDQFCVAYFLPPTVNENAGQSAAIRNGTNDEKDTSSSSDADQSNSV
jgi:hypothetical protein